MNDAGSPGGISALETAPRILCVVGLGNTGRRYEGTRHNIGFAVIEKLAERLAVREFFLDRTMHVLEADHGTTRMLLCKPLTFMNLSGTAVATLLDRSHLNPSQLLVVYDDVALPIGTLRLRAQGSSGGHNGMQSIIDAIGTQRFPRLRCGIGAADEGGTMVDHVLSRFTRSEQERIEPMILRAADAIASLPEVGIDRAMNLYNTPSSDAPSRAEQPPDSPGGTG